MSDTKSFHPSEAELEILQILWRNEPCTVKEVHEAISKHKNVGYTTVLKQMQRMHHSDKGMLERYKEGKLHYYSALVQESQVKTSSFDHLVNTVFNGSKSELLLHALGHQTTSREELEELEKWLKERKNK